MRQDTDRRTFLLAAGATATTVALAGCNGNGDDEEDGDDETDQPEETENGDGENGNGNGNGENGNGDGENGDGDGENGNGDVPEGVPEEVHQYLTENNANLYENELADMTGEDAITIMNGAGEDNVAFDPPAVRIDAGTEVTWEWTGLGGSHNVESRDVSDFEFENPEGLVSEEGHTWTHTFEETGNAIYQCIAHASIGQHGAIVIE